MTKVWQPHIERIEGPNLITLGMVSMSEALAKQIWVVLTKDERYLISKQHGTVSSASVDLATFFGSQDEAQNYLAQLEVGTGARCKPFPLWEWCMRLMQKRRLTQAEDAGGEPAKEIP